MTATQSRLSVWLPSRRAMVSTRTSHSRLSVPHATPWLCRLARAYELRQPAWHRFAVRHAHAPARADVFGNAHAVLLAERLRDAIEELACEHDGVRIDAYEQVPVAHVVGLVRAKCNGLSQRDADALHVGHAVDVNVADDDAHADRHGQAAPH